MSERLYGRAFLFPDRSHRFVLVHDFVHRFI